MGLGQLRVVLRLSTPAFAVCDICEIIVKSIILVGNFLPELRVGFVLYRAAICVAFIDIAGTPAAIGAPQSRDHFRHSLAGKL